MLKNLITTLCLSSVIIIFGFFVFMPKTEAQQGSILPKLLDLPAPPPPNPLIKNIYSEKTPEFFNPLTPPPDDAPIEDLLAYWAGQNNTNAVFNYTVEPSDRVLERLLQEIEKNPGTINSYLNVLSRKPESADAVKRIYDRVLKDDNEENYQAEDLRRWLMYNSNYFSDELLEIAQLAKDTGEYITNHEDVLALARVDWEKARPLLDRMLNDSSQPISQTLANWAFYLHALKEENSSEAETYRKALMRTVEDRNAKPGNRDLALDALVYGGDFPGRDDWYFSLLEDETLYDLRVNGASYTGLTTLIMRSPPDKYVDKMIELLGSSNKNVRNAAVRNLASVLRANDPKVIKALLPWLEDPNWAKETGTERRFVVAALAQIEMPESVPGLIAVLNEKATIEVYEDRPYANSNRMSGYANSNTAVLDSLVKVNREVYPYRDAAVDALIKQRSFQAAAALREVLPKIQRWKRSDVIKAILLSGGFSIGEQIESLELKAREVKELNAKVAKYREEQIKAGVADSDGQENYDADYGAAIANANVYTGRVSDEETFNPADIKPMLGEQLISIEDPSDELVSAAVFRVKTLEKSEPETAGIVKSFMQNWKGTAVNAFLLNDLAEGNADINVVVKLLSLRKELREKQIGNIYDLKSRGNPVAIGIAACLLESEGEYSGILANGGDETKTALFGCARLIRARIPVQTAAQFLKSPNKTLALAAERYIESEDSPAARQIIYSLYPNEAKILGATLFFGDKPDTISRPDFIFNLFASVNGLQSLPPYYFYMSQNLKNDSAEEKLRKEVKEDEKVLGIYAYNKNYVRIYSDKAVFSWEEDDARYFERKLENSEFEYLKRYLASNDVNNLPPFISYCGGCQSQQLLMLSRQGGRRVFVSGNQKPQFFADLENIFEDMRKPSAKLRYWLEKDIPNAQILLADKDLEAVTVWKNGDDLRVLINNKRREEDIRKELDKLAELDQENENLEYEQTLILDSKRRAERFFESYSWFKFSGNKLSDPANQPPEVQYIVPSGNVLTENKFDNWSAKAGNVEVRTGGDSIYKVTNGQSVKIQTGYYRNPVITPNGNWVALAKYVEEEDALIITRINLQNNKEFRVKLDGKFRFAKPLAHISANNKILIGAGNVMDYQIEKVKFGSYFLLDPETGAIQPTKGEFRPFAQKTFRELQKTSKPDEVWAAIPDENKKETQIGTLNTKSFEFKEVLKVPQISFDSMNMWVDEAENKVFIVYNEQLLSIPLKKETSEPEKSM